MKSNQSIPIIVAVTLGMGVVAYLFFGKKEQKEQGLAGNSNIQPQQNQGYNYEYERDSNYSAEPYNEGNYRISLTGGKRTKRKRHRKRRSRRQRK